MQVHVTLQGRKIEYPDPSPELARFLRRIVKMVEDPAVTEDDVKLALYSKDNPILEPTLFGERGAVTKATLQNPVYRVMTDLLFRKHVAEHRVDVSALADSFTVSMSDAAEQKGVSKSTISQAIESGRLEAWVKGSSVFLRRRDVEAFEVGTRGPKPVNRERPAPKAPSGEPLTVRFGNAPGISFRIKHPGDMQDVKRLDEHILDGKIVDWRRVGVMSGRDGKHRFLLLVPSEKEAELLMGPFHIRGLFEYAVKVNNPEEARAAWKSFAAE